MNPLYTAEATAIGGREGQVRTTDGLLDLKLAIPRELGGPGGHTNPEQLFAAGFAACFENALRFVSRKLKYPLSDASVTARVEIVPNGDLGFRLQVGLTVFTYGLDQATSQAAIVAAEQACPYSNAVKGNVEVSITPVLR